MRNARQSLTVMRSVQIWTVSVASGDRAWHGVMCCAESDTQQDDQVIDVLLDWEPLVKSVIISIISSILIIIILIISVISIIIAIRPELSG